MIALHPSSSGFLRLMRSRDYALLWTSQGISLIGDRLHWIAISLWIFAQTRSALSVSYAIIALMIGPAVIGLFAGVYVDRWNRKSIMIVADIVRGVLVSLIPWLMGRDIRLVYIDLFLISAATAFFRPAMLATIPQTISRAELLSANSFFTALDTATDVIGPILAGVLVQASGYSIAMYVDAATYFASASILLFLSAGQCFAAERGKQEARFLAEFKESLGYIRGDRLQLGLLMLIFLGWWVSGLNSLQTPLAKGVVGLSDEQFGWFNGVWGTGLVAASLLMGWYGSYFRKGRLIGAGFLGWAFATGIMGISANAGMLFVAAFWVGFANIVLFVSVATAIMEVTPSNMLGRVITVRQIALAVTRTLAMVGFGALADTVGVRHAVLSMAGLSLVGVATGLFLFPEVSRFGASVHQPTMQLGREPVFKQHSSLFRTLMNSSDSSYLVQSQTTINRATLLIVFSAWTALLLGNPRLGLYVVIVVLTVTIMSLARGRRGIADGSKNVRRRVRLDSRDFKEGGRTRIGTGPTAE